MDPLTFFHDLFCFDLYRIHYFIFRFYFHRHCPVFFFFFFLRTTVGLFGFWLLLFFVPRCLVLVTLHAFVSIIIIIIIIIIIKDTSKGPT